jgi:hypothetical protein
MRSIAPQFGNLVGEILRNDGLRIRLSYYDGPDGCYLSLQPWRVLDVALEPIARDTRIFAQNADEFATLINRGADLIRQRSRNGAGPSSATKGKDREWNNHGQ